jgi:protein involved in polysaccharide export with SLBB domain
MKQQRVLLAMVLAVLVGGCDRPITVPPLSQSDMAEMNAVGNFPDEIYRLEPGDAIQIRYTHHPELAQDEVIRPDGKINARLVGPIAVAGLTKEELGKLLIKRTADQLKDAEVVVSISRYSQKFVYVAGEVARAGTVPYRKGLTPLQAITASGVFRDTARYDSVILMRTGVSEETSAETFVARKLNLAQATNDGVKEPVVLAPHDVVFVPRTNIADANIWVRQNITDIVPLFRGLGVSIPISAF